MVSLTFFYYPHQRIDRKRSGFQARRGELDRPPRAFSGEGAVMVRKRRTKLPGSGDGCNAGSGSQDDGARQGGTPQPSGMPREDGAQRPPAVQLEGGAHNDPASQKLCNVAATGWVPANPQPQGGRGRGSYHQPQGLPQGRGEPQQHQSSPGLSAPASYSGASSSRPSNVPMEQFQNLSIHTEPPIDKSRILASGEDMRPPARPEKKGILGTKCVVKANHFLATTQNKYLYQYDVSITPEVTSRVVNRAVMKKLVEMYKASHLGGRLPVYDGNKNLYTAGPLPFTSNEFHVALVDEDGGTGAERRQKNFRIVIKFAAGIDQNLLDMFLDGKLADIPQKVLQVLDIVLRERPATKYYSVGRSFYFRGDKADHSTQSLGGGLESRRGFYQSLRPTQMGLSLNIDMSSASFIEAVPVIDFVKQLLNKSTNVLSRPLTDSDRAKINKALRGVKVEVTHRANMRRKYRITALTSQATRELAFQVDERGLMKTVVQYFQETYRFTIQHTNWPCLQVGNQQRPNYLPMEVCKIVEGQRYSKRLNERQMTALLTTTCQLPQKRRSDIKNTVLENGYGSDSYAMEFGIKITEELTSVKARILNPPRLKYHDTGMEKECLPAMGQWNMMNKKMVNGGRVKKWICICFSEKADIRTVTKFCEKLVGICQTSGMEFESMPQYQHSRERPDQVERALKEHHQQNKNLDLLVAILPHNNGSLYGNLKRICETELGIISQCCLEKNIYNPTKQYLANVALKINVKVGGRNTVLLDALSRRMPLIERSPTIIFGADVTHPHPGEDSSPSIAAVVASQDWPEITKYVGLVCAQPHRKELIEKLYTYEFDPVIGHKHGGMIRELLQSFYQATRSKPKRIIFYRDGVSEGQFQLVMENELKAIMKACISLDESYQPPVTFVVVQKRHRTKLFPEENSKKQSTDRTGNIVPGTVVDSAICHPREFDFYLCSHAGIKGTSRPAHYHVLWDDNNFSADELQTFTNNLCYTYARCTKSVSIVPPAYYAHLAAFRARFYMEAEPSESASIPNGPRITRANRDRPVRPLPALKDNVQSVMFFC